MRNLDFLPRLYDWSLRLYPVSFRERFVSEMSDVFQNALEDASQDGFSAVFSFCLREAWEYPFNLCRQHWVQFTRQEIIMATRLSTNKNKTCPRCQQSNQPESKYCLNCGRAFIPFKEYITEQSRHLVNATFLLRVFEVMVFVILSLIAADRILFHGFHPTTNIIVLSGLAIFSFLAGWRLFGNTSNFKKLRFLVIIAVITLAFFKLTSELDELYLRNILTTEKPLTYQFLDSETFVAYVEEKQAFYTDQHLTQNSWMQMYIFSPPFDNLGIDGLAIKPTQSNNTLMIDNYPALVIERSWTHRGYYGLFLMLFIAACLSAGFFTTKRIAMRSFVQNF